MLAITLLLACAVWRLEDKGTRTLRTSARMAAMTLVALLALVTPAALAPTMAAAAGDGLVVHNALNETSGTTLADSSGNGRDATLSGGAAFIRGEGPTFGGTDGYVKLPDNLMGGLDQITIALNVRIDTDQQTPYFIYGLGNSTSGVGNGYLFTTGNGYRTTIATSNWSTEQTVSTSANLDRGVWRHLTYTLSGGAAVLYQDGVEVARKIGMTTKPGDSAGAPRPPTTSAGRCTARTSTSKARCATSAYTTMP